MKQSHIELQDYHLESSKTESLLLSSQSADQNTSNKQLEIITTHSDTIQSKLEKSMQVKDTVFFHFYFFTEHSNCRLQL